MKGVVIFDQLNDIVFYRADEEMKKHLHGLCLREGLLSSRSEMDDTKAAHALDLNALVQLFSPLVTSQRIMLSQFNNPYTAVHSQDGTIMTFAERLGFLFLAIGTERDESLATVRRRLHVFLRLVNFVCGASFNSLKFPCQGYGGRQNLLHKLMGAWENLRKEELSYLIEAVERLLVNQFLGAACIELLENVLEKIRHLEQENVASHAFLLVNTKLLALFSSRNSSELKSSDLLTLILMVHVHHPSSRVELPRSPCRTPCRTPSPSVSSLKPDHADQSSQVHPDGGKKRDLLEVPKSFSDDESSDSEAFFSPCGTPPHVENIEKAIDALNVYAEEVKRPSQITTASVPEESDTLNEDAGWALTPSNEDFTADVVFLKTINSTATPHTVHTVKIMDGVVLIIICNIGKSILSGAIIQMLETLHDIQINKRPEQGKQVLEFLDFNMKRLLDGLKKLGKNDMEAFVKQLLIRWDNVKKNGLSEFLKNSTTQFMTSRLESSVSNLMDILRDGFRLVCLPQVSTNIPITAENSRVLVDIQAHIRFSLADYADYLRIKALRNITITTYSSQYPGLVYFIHVNRSNHLLTVPTMDLQGTSNIKDTSMAMLRKKICHMVEFTRVQLQLGHFSIIWKDDAFQYSFFLWFEDSKGEPLKPNIFLNGLRNFPPPGILCGEFYRLLRKEGFPDHSSDSIQCYELLCMHQAATPVPRIVEHVRHLAATIWDLTGVKNPIDFL